MLWKFVLTVRVNLEFLENHGKKTATLVGVQVLEWHCVVRDSVSISSPEIFTCSLRIPVKTRAASLNVTKKVLRTAKLSPS